jgi:WS/DGAT/MGAT family acyltransferase
MYLIDGLSDDRFALVTKTHQAVVDGLTAIDVTQVILDAVPDAPITTSDRWSPAEEPSGLDLVASSLTESIMHPAVAIEAAKATAGQLVSAASTMGSKALEIATSVVSVARPATTTPLNVTIGEQRRFATADFVLADFKLIHRMLDCTVNDVMLCVLTGALRSWLMARGAPVSSRSQLRAVVPFSTTDAGSPVSAFLIDLPTGEPYPIVRLRRINYETSQLKDVAQLLGAESIITAVGFGPPTLHALGARLAARLSSRIYNIAVTNVPGPQQPLYLAGARLLASYPVMPLTKNQAISVGLTSYDGSVFVAVNADHDSVRDLTDLIEGFGEALVELKEAVEVHVGRSWRGPQRADDADGTEGSTSAT